MVMAASRAIRLAVACAAASLGALATTGAAADAVILDSTAPGLSIGQVIAEGQRLSLPGGASVTLMTRSGQSLTLTGPFDGAVPADAGPGRDGVADMMRNQGVQMRDLGATRTLRGE